MVCRCHGPSYLLVWETRLDHSNLLVWETRLDHSDLLVWETRLDHSNLLVGDTWLDLPSKIIKLSSVRKARGLGPAQPHRVSRSLSLSLALARSLSLSLFPSFSLTHSITLSPTHCTSTYAGVMEKAASPCAPARLCPAPSLCSPGR